MGMIGYFYALKDEDLDALVENPNRLNKLQDPRHPPPERTGRLVEDPNQLNKLQGRPAPERKLSLLGRFFGKKARMLAQADSWSPTEPPEPFDVDKAWQGIHFLLTGSRGKGAGPRAFILHGGRRIGMNFGYGPAHGFSAAEVKQIAHALEQVDVDALYDQTDPAMLTAEEIYPNVWHDEPKEECIGYLIEYLKELKTFVTKAAQTNRALVAYLR
jgi:hypothetical protein